MKEQVHATCVAIDGKGVLLRGPSGAGKSDLALRLIDQGAALVSDDRTDLSRRQGNLLASSPATIAGLLEVRGVGILRFEPERDIPVLLNVDLQERSKIERLPRRETITILGMDIRYLTLFAFEASAPAKVRLALAWACGDIIGIDD